MMALQEMAVLNGLNKKTVGKTKNTQMAVTGKWHGCHFKNKGLQKVIEL